MGSAAPTSPPSLSPPPQHGTTRGTRRWCVCDAGMGAAYETTEISSLNSHLSSSPNLRQQPPRNPILPPAAAAAAPRPEGCSGDGDREEGDVGVRGGAGQGGGGEQAQDGGSQPAPPLRCRRHLRPQDPLPHEAQEAQDHRRGDPRAFAAQEVMPARPPPRGQVRRCLRGDYVNLWGGSGGDPLRQVLWRGVEQVRGGRSLATTSTPTAATTTSASKTKVNFGSRNQRKTVPPP